MTKPKLAYETFPGHRVDLYAQTGQMDPDSIPAYVPARDRVVEFVETLTPGQLVQIETDTAGTITVWYWQLPA